MQIITECFLSMHYRIGVDLAFASVGHIMRDVSHGFLLRYFHFCVNFGNAFKHTSITIGKGLGGSEQNLLVYTFKNKPVIG